MMLMRVPVLLRMAVFMLVPVLVTMMRFVCVVVIVLILVRVVMIVVMLMGVVMLMFVRVVMIVGVPVSVGMRMLMFMPLRSGIFSCEYVHLGRGNSAANHLACLYARSHIERRGCLGEYRKRHAGIHHGAQQHVSADSGKTIQVGYTHRA